MRDGKDIRILRGLVGRYADVCARDVQRERRDLWRRHNSLERTRPLIYVRAFACWGEMPQSRLRCEDPFFRGHENALRQMIFQDSLEDDSVLEPWLVQRAAHVLPPEGPWGVKVRHTPSTEKGGAWKFDPPLRRPEDIERLARPRHLIDEEETARRADRIRDAVGDILPVVVDRSPFYQVWHADISYDLAQLRGLEQAMWDMVDNPDRLHRLVGFLRDGILAVHDEAEAAGDWRLFNQVNQAMPYSRELPDPRPDGGPVGRERLWCFAAAQEMAQVSPAMHEEFILDYQLPIIERFGLVAYGCCEDLTNKIEMLRKVPNLRRIAVTPAADVARCAEQIGDDYVLSWRPNPALMVCCGFDEDRIRRVVRQAMAAMRGCRVDITLKDVQTIQGEPERLRRWTEIVREVTEDGP